MSPYGFQKAPMAIAVLTGELKDVKSTDAEYNFILMLKHNSSFFIIFRFRVKC